MFFRKTRVENLVVSELVSNPNKEDVLLMFNTTNEVKYYEKQLLEEVIVYSILQNRDKKISFVEFW